MKKMFAVLLALLLWLPAARAETALRWIEGGDADRVHLRAAPTTAAESLGLYFTGTEAILLDEADGWAHVMVGAVEGWMMADYLSGGYLPQIGPWYVVDNPSGTWVNLRTALSMEAAVAMTPGNGRKVRLLGETADGWSYVECSGAKGYILTSMLSPVGDVKSTATTVLGQTAELYYIHQYTAPNGQDIYFTAWEDNVYLAYQDVNFDGIEDIVVDSITSANNLFSEFFVYDASSGAYVRAEMNGEEERLCNYALYPEYGLVMTYTNAGNAGLLHVKNLYRWEGTELKLIRSAVSDEWAEDIFEGQTYIQIIHGDILHMTVCDYTLGSYDESVVWEVIIPRDDADIESLYEQEMNALWQGIR